MISARPVAGSALALLLALGACRGGDTPANGSSEAFVPVDASGNSMGNGISSVTTVEVSGSTTAGATPMAERVAVLGLLNKRNGVATELTLKPGQSQRVGDVIVHLRACERTAPWEQDQYTGAFVQVDVEQADKSWRRVFSGWLYKERPALNVVQHPIYDVWPKSCTMTFPATGPDTVDVGAGPAGSSAGKAVGNESSAPNSPSTEGEPTASPPEVSPSAAPSNAM